MSIRMPRDDPLDQTLLFGPKINESTNRATNTKNRIRAIPTAAPAIPVKPKRPAIRAMMKNVTAQRNMLATPLRFSPNKIVSGMPKSVKKLEVGRRRTIRTLGWGNIEPSGKNDMRKYRQNRRG